MRLYNYNVLFTFPSICEACAQEAYDCDGPIENNHQQISINDIQESGWPICGMCDNELDTSDDYCEVKP